METPKYPPPYPNYVIPPEYGAPVKTPDYVPPPPLVVTTQPSAAVVPPPVYRDFLVCSIVNLFCFLPLGLLALIFSIETCRANKRKDYVAAASCSRSAYITNVLTCVFGFCINIAWIVYVLLFVTSVTRFTDAIDTDLPLRKEKF
ncbi:hypothetical protein GDO81_016918 [Engystomops pustulosus]|uniref:Uncharacterized protein n=1 Tax=Engystomops pustulosus TaxID=76066 RepID=A0AAV7A9R8_ENGPU|nr:hypothetical protein GDO81_016918 [Engystomops pustulosus]